MPDRLDFDHLVDHGAVYHRCIECGWPGWGVIVPEKERERHHRTHTRAHEQEVAKQQKANLALARKARKQYRQEEA